MATNLDVPVPDGEPYKEGYEAHDQDGHAQHTAPLYPVQGQDTGRRVNAGLTARCTGKAVIRTVIAMRQALKMKISNCLCLHIYRKAQSLGLFQVYFSMCSGKCPCRSHSRGHREGSNTYCRSQEAGPEKRLNI